MKEFDGDAQRDEDQPHQLRITHDIKKSNRLWAASPKKFTTFEIALSQ
jgi:hypothetical protein